VHRDRAMKWRLLRNPGLRGSWFGFFFWGLRGTGDDNTVFLEKLFLLLA
jgi:hypothetical protein